ncbi:hypothetical protein F5887DRAFT_950363 [Amanita rubescens]|nr:hypothetical protein F5887DRAFT_950363 [Amanita rubescens]
MSPWLYAWLHPQLGRTPELGISLVIGNVISYCLFGALTVQLYMYYITFDNDPKTLKAIIYIIYFTEVVYTAILSYDLVDLVVTPTYEGCFVWVVVPVCGGIVALLTQAVFAYRIRIITQMKFIPLCLVALVVVEIVVTSVLISLRISFYLTALIWAACCLVADLTIAIIMVRALKRDKIYSRRLRRRVTRLVQLFVGSGVLTVAVNIVTLAGSLYSTFITLSCGIVLSKIYANSMMVLVNSRISSEDESSHGQVATLEIGTLRFESLAAGSTAKTMSTTTDEEREEQQPKDTLVTGEA